MKIGRLLGAQVAIGAAAIFARFALTAAGPLAASALRLAIAAAIVLLLAARVRDARTPLGPGREFAFAVAGLALAVHFATWIASLRFTSVAISTLLVTTTPLWSSLYEAIGLRRPRSPRFWLALAVATAGIALVATARGAPAPVSGQAALGAALALLGAVALSIYLALVERTASARAMRVPTIAIVARTYFWAAVTLAAAALLTHDPGPGSSLPAWGGILGMALVSQLLGHTALNAALREVPPSTVAFSTLLEPAIAAALAAIVFSEPIGLATLAGGGLILGAVYAVLASTRA